MLVLRSTVGNRNTLRGGTVECDKCNARWECVTEGVCSYCGKRTLVDVDDNAQNSVCVDCLTYEGDGVNHSSVCDRVRGSGYTHCACRDCMETVVSADVSRPEMCRECKDAGCSGGECRRVE